MADDKIIMIHETARESIARDLGTAATIIGLWSLGWFAGSAALEWVGVIMALTFIVAGAAKKIKGEKRSMTPQEARDWLDKTFPEAAP